VAVWVGTSGYNYPEWKGSFYPERLPPARMLPYYAEHFATVEINYTFYRMPTEKIVLGWHAATPERFALTLKAPKRITHDTRLREAGDELRQFLQVASTLGPKLGVLLFQLPPNLRKDTPLLRAFLEQLPPGVRAAFEFRHASWFDDEVYRVLADRNVALCIADSEKLTTPLVDTADFGYFRLRDEGYTAGDIGRWAGVVAGAAAPDRDVFVYFKHEEQGKGPAFARMLLEDVNAEFRIQNHGMRNEK
jgi:uncharacterized protein YecE (DUF72 family)